MSTCLRPWSPIVVSSVQLRAKRHPNVEDNVTIYPNATILGGDTTIGARSTIGANVFLMKSVPPDMLYALGEQELRVLDKKERGK